MIEQETRLKSLQWLYLTNQPDLFPINKHLIWQSPLLLPENLSDLDELDRRVKHAGELWLQNHDLRPFNLLIITHSQAKISYVFQRPQKPGQLGISIGPISQCLLKEGKSLSPYSLIFSEFRKTIDPNIISGEPKFFNSLTNGESV